MLHLSLHQNNNNNKKETHKKMPTEMVESSAVRVMGQDEQSQTACTFFF